MVSSGYPCGKCGKNLISRVALASHTTDKHHECQYCGLASNSRKARLRHESASHNLKCTRCSMSFTDGTALQLHELTVPHFQCCYCPAKLLTAAHKEGHEISCPRNPANCAVRPTLALSTQPGSSTSNHPKPVETVGELSPSDAVTKDTNEGSEPPVCPSPSSCDGEMFHSTSSLPSTDANDKEATVAQPCACAHSLEPNTCSICQPLNKESFVLDDAESVVSADENHLDSGEDHRDVIFQCTPCLELFETEEAFRTHVCASRRAMLRPHCPVCYTRFDDGPSLQNHLEGLQSFSCQLCLTRCCSDEMLQDHLLSHPTCGKCGKSFADSLTLCAVRVLRSHDHLVDKHSHPLILSLFVST